MATTFREYNAPATYSFTFPSYQSSDVKVRVDGVLKTAGTHYNITGYSTTGGGTVAFIDNSGSGGTNHTPSSGVVRIYRDTNVDSPKADYTAGSSVKAADLNNNHKQLLFKAQEEQLPQQIHHYDIDDGAIIESKISASAVTTAKLGDNAVTTSKITDANITTAKIADNAVTMAKLNSGALPTDITVASANIVDGTIVEADLSNSAISSNKIADNAVTTTEILNGAVTRAKLEADIIDSTKIENGAVGHEHIQTDAVRTAKIQDAAVTTAKIADDAVTTAKIADSNVTTTKIADDGVTTAKIAGGAVGNTELANGAVITDRIADNAVTADKIADGVIVTNSEQASHTVNDTTFFTTAAAEARYFNASTGETIKDGQTFPDNDTTIATTAAINDRIIDLIDDVGGFVPIANETSFPTANPDVNNGTGTIVSVSAASTNLAPSGTTVTIANGAGTGNTVTITGVSSTIPSGFGFLVETTSTLHTYTFHRLVPKATEVTTVAGKATEIGRLGTADAVADMAILGTADVVADLNTLGTADVVSDMNALAVADVISDMNTLAVTDVINDMDTVATNVTNVNNVGNSIANVNTTAGSIANVNTVAGSISNVNTVGGAISNVNTTAGSISNVNTVASNISNVNSFFNVYRIGANNPTSSLDVGDLFFNTTSNSLKVYTGSAWVDGVTATGNFAVTTGNTFTGSNVYNDNVKAIFGTGSDMEIFHYNGFGFITNTDGILHLRSVDGIKLQDQGGNEVFVNCIDNAAVELFYDNSKKLETISTGVLVTGKVAATGDLALTSSDGQKIRIGESNDLEIYHDGSTNNIASSNGNLVLSQPSGTFKIMKGSSENIFKGIVDGATELFYDNSNKLQTTSTGINVTGVTVDDGATHDGDVTFKGNTSGTDLVWDKSHDNLKFNDSVYARFGTGSDLQIYHDGSNSIIDNTTGELRIQNDSTVRVMATNFNVVDENNSDTIINAASDGAVQLYYDNSKMFETLSVGTKTYGQHQISTGDNSYLSLLNTNGQGTAYVRNYQGDLLIESPDDVIIESGSSSEVMAKFIGDGAVELYHDNSKVFSTESNGIQVLAKEGFSAFLRLYADEGDDNADQYWLKTEQDGTGFHIQNNVSGSTETNLRALGNGTTELYYDNSKKLETTSTGISVNGDIDGIPDGSKILVGTHDDLQLYHASNASYIKASNHTIHLDSGTTSAIRIISGGSTTYGKMADFNTDGSVDLFYDNNKKFETTSSGVAINGNATFPDGSQAIFGAGSDMEIYHIADNTNVIRGPGKITIQTDDTTSGIKLSSYSGGETFAQFIKNGAVELYYDNSKKLDTFSSGVTVYGNLAVNDNGLLAVGTSADLQIYHDGSNNYIKGTGSHDLIFGTNGYNRFRLDSDGHVRPESTNARDLGTSTYRWRNVYTNDLNLSNEGGANDVDGTWGNWTIQEGESDLFLKNNRSGKKYKFNLMEVV